MLWQRRTTMPCGKRRRFMYRYFHVETLGGVYDKQHGTDTTGTPDGNTRLG